MPDPTAPDQSLLGHIIQVYRDSKKERDIFWNLYVARPLAAPLVYALAQTPITPNQVTFLGALIFSGALATLLLWGGPLGLLVAALIIQLAYVFDCADGQLARLTGRSSPVGAYLDFLVDEFKALGLVAAFCLRLSVAQPGHAHTFLITGLLGTVLVAIATSLTTFVRRPEYAGQTVKHGVKSVKPKPTSALGWALRAVENTAQWLIHYPSWILYVALLDFLPQVSGDLLFLALFLGVYALYTAKTGLAVVVKLGRPTPKA